MMATLAFIQLSKTDLLYLPTHFIIVKYLTLKFISRYSLCGNMTLYDTLRPFGTKI